MSDERDFHIQLKFSENKKWAVVDIETKEPFTGKTLAVLMRNLADSIEQEPSLNEEDQTNPGESAGQLSTPDSGTDGVSAADGAVPADTKASTDADDYCGAV